jgi:hypothetical protein
MKTLRAAAIALVIAVIVLVVAVLPAEYGIDPLGTGRALGLTALSGTEERPAAADDETAAPQAVSLANDTYTVELRPFEGVEYKYRLEQGRALVYEWTSSAPVEWDLHGEPDGTDPKDAVSYEKNTGTSARGVFTAATPGVHGWFWENTGEGRITLTLKTSGFFTASTEYRDGERLKRTFGAAAPQK